MDDEAPPREVPGYEFLEQVAVGGRGQIYLARDLHGDGELVALKFLKEEDLGQRDRVQAFLDEVQVSKLLLHPNIVRVFGGDVAGGLPYLTMEFVDGITVWEVIELTRLCDGTIPLGVGAYIVAMVADALDYAHSLRGPDGEKLNLIHRDVSAVNVMVTFDGAVKLLDFGIARSKLSSLRTAPGIVKGKLDYLSPEQCTGRSLDARTDIYSLGVVLFELVTGRRPYNEQDLGDMFDKISRGDRPRAHRLRSDVSPRMERIIDRSMATKNKARYATAGKMLEDLRAYMERLPDRPTSSTLAEFLAEIAPDQLSRVQDSYGPPDTTSVSEMRAAVVHDLRKRVAAGDADPTDGGCRDAGELPLVDVRSDTSAGEPTTRPRLHQKKESPSGGRRQALWALLALLATGLVGFGLGAVLVTTRGEGGSPASVIRERLAAFGVPGLGRDAAGPPALSRAIVSADGGSDAAVGDGGQQGSCGPEAGSFLDATASGTAHDAGRDASSASEPHRDGDMGDAVTPEAGGRDARVAADAPDSAGQPEAGAADSGDAALAAHGFVTVETRRRRMLFVGRRRIGLTPVERLPLLPGRYVLKVRGRNGVRRRTVDVSAGDDVTLRFDF